MSSNDPTTQVTAASKRCEMIEMHVQLFQVSVLNIEGFNGTAKSRNDMSYNIKETPWNSRALRHVTLLNLADAIDAHAPRAFRAPEAWFLWWQFSQALLLRKQ